MRMCNHIEPNIEIFEEQGTAYWWILRKKTDTYTNILCQRHTRTHTHTHTRCSCLVYIHFQSLSPSFAHTNTFHSRTRTHSLNQAYVHTRTHMRANTLARMWISGLLSCHTGQDVLTVTGADQQRLWHPPTSACMWSSQGCSGVLAFFHPSSSRSLLSNESNTDSKVTQSKYMGRSFSSSLSRVRALCLSLDVSKEASRQCPRLDKLKVDCKKSSSIRITLQFEWGLDAQTHNLNVAFLTPNETW